MVKELINHHEILAVNILFAWESYIELKKGYKFGLR
jgi:hypothetical protein